MLALEDVEIGATDTDMAHVDQCPPLRRVIRRRPFLKHQFPRREASDDFDTGTHESGFARDICLLSANGTARRIARRAASGLLKP